MSDEEPAGGYRRHPIGELVDSMGTSGTNHTVAITDFDNLSGFWKGENATPSPVRLVSGDQVQFNSDLQRCKGRSRARLDKMQNNRFLLAHTWPEELALVDKWCDESLIYSIDEEK